MLLHGRQMDTVFIPAGHCNIHFFSFFFILKELLLLLSVPE